MENGSHRNIKLFLFGIIVICRLQINLFCLYLEVKGKSLSQRLLVHVYLPIEYNRGRSISAMPTGIKKEKDIPGLPEY